MAEEFDKSTILDSFLDEVNAYLPDIEANLDRLQQNPGNTEALEETYRRTHTIGGSAAMMDFSGLAHVAQGMEEVLGEALDGGMPLTAPTIALLRRSHGRLSRLVASVRAENSTEDAAIVAEDDADRAASRSAGYGASGLTSFGANGASGLHNLSPNGLNSTGELPSMQLPDWLAAFAGGPASAPLTADQIQAAQAAADAAEQAANGNASGVSDLPTGRLPTAGPPVNGNSSGVADLPTGRLPSAPTPPGARTTDSFYPSSPSAPSSPMNPMPPAGGMDVAEMGTGLMPTVGGASRPGSSNSWQMPPAQRDSGLPPTETPPWLRPSDPNNVSQPTTSSAPAIPTRPASPVPASGAAGAAGAATGGPALDELRVDEEAVRRQVATLRDTVVQLREAAQAMENERTELRGFLDGSHDALDRLEEWAGRQMGLDLPNSPDAVRRYLPLSVIFVTTARLKNLVTLLHGASRNLTVTQEQIEESLTELRSAIEGFGSVYRSAATMGNPANGFSATVAQFSYAPPQPPTVAAGGGTERPAQERLSPGARVDLERQVREELRRELEDDVREEIALEMRGEEQERLRHELEIQVRRQLLADLAPGLGTAAAMANDGGTIQGLPQLPFTLDHSPRAEQVTSEQSPEALEVFRDEAQEHLHTITTGIADLERSPGDIEVLRSIRRAMHTLKGAAGMMGFSLIQELAHASEDLLERLADQEISFSPSVLSLILDTSEALDQLVSGGAGDHGQQAALVQELTRRYTRFTGVPASSSDSAHTMVGQPDMTDYPANDRPAEEPRPSTDLSVRLQLSKLDDLVNLFGELLINRSVLEERIERLSQLTSEEVRVNDRMREVGGQLGTRFEAATLPSGSAGAGRGSPGSNGGGSRFPFLGGGSRQSSQAQGFDELELDRYNEFHRLSRGLSEAVDDATSLSREMEALIREIQTSFARENRLSSDFQDRLLKARLVPLQSLVPRLYRAARASALRQGKEVEFFVQGTETEVDRKVFEEVEGPLLHLIRNAVTHGIETPDERERAGKPRAGRIYVIAAYEGNQVVISVRDDGAGVDPEKVRIKAVARGLLDARAQLSQQEAIDFIFRPGYSTADTVTEESGRGVGLDVVRDVVAKLRGTVEVDSSIGQGTFFTLKFPISLQIARSVLVRVGQQTLAIPMAVVQQIGRLDYYQRVPGTPPSVDVRGQRYMLMHLASYLKLPMPPISEHSSVLLVNAGRFRVALLVDAVVSQQEVVSKPLGAHLRDVPGVSGATVLGNGQVVLILELHELLAQPVREVVALPEPGQAPPTSTTPMPAVQPSRSSGVFNIPGVTTSQLPTGPLPSGWESKLNPAIGAGTPPGGGRSTGSLVMPTRSTGLPMHGQMVPPAARNSYVLVVDDSPSVRRVVSGMLKAHGWQVQTARDGVEALEVIARERPAAVLLDIEMPRMDGYELMATIRSQEQYRTLPLVVLTSRAAAKHQQRAMQLGANAYVVKPYQDEDLLRKLAELTAAGY